MKQWTDPQHAHLADTPPPSSGWMAREKSRGHKIAHQSPRTPVKLHLQFSQIAEATRFSAAGRCRP
jgi:hypothetical protein